MEIKNVKHIAKGVCFCEVWTPEICRSILDHYQSVEWKPGQVYSIGKDIATVDYNQKKAFNLDINLSKDISVAKHYDKNIVIKTGKEHLEVEATDLHTLTLTKYPDGGFFKKHIDGKARGSQNIAGRQLSFVIYLNDDFEGGETRFHKLGVSVKPKTGYAALFKSTLLHSSLPNIGGEKFILTGFYY